MEKATCQTYRSNVDTLIRRCIETRNLQLGRAIHANLVKASLNLLPFLANHLIHLYSLCKSISCACAVFRDIPALRRNRHSWIALLSAHAQAGLLDTARRILRLMPHPPDIVAYNTMISCLSRHGRPREALALLRQLHLAGIPVDRYTVAAAAPACADSIRQLHGLTVTTGVEPDEILDRSLIRSYARCDDPDTARQLFDRMPKRDASTESDAWTSLFAAYARTGRLEEARAAFERLLERNVVRWTALIGAHVREHRGEEALALLAEMTQTATRPNSFTFVAALHACADLALINPGKQLHGRITRGSGTTEIIVGNALIHFYCKCGDMPSATAVFERMPARDAITWNTVLAGFAQHGMARQAVDVFETMARSRVPPTRVTFLSLLSACNHAGLVDEGRRYFNLMEEEYGLPPGREHYAVLVDLLGRSRRIEEAVRLIERMPDGSGMRDLRCWGSLLAACRLHGEVELGSRAAWLLFELALETPGGTSCYPMFTLPLGNGRIVLARGGC